MREKSEGILVTNGEKSKSTRASNHVHVESKEVKERKMEDSVSSFEVGRDVDDERGKEQIGGPRTTMASERGKDSYTKPQTASVCSFVSFSGDYQIRSYHFFFSTF